MDIPSNRRQASLNVGKEEFLSTLQKQNNALEILARILEKAKYNQLTLSDQK